MIKRIKNEVEEFKLLLNCVPPPILILFVMSVFSMNLLANKSLDLPFDWLALDCGIIVSWIAFLTMDIITVHFGPKAASEISLFAMSFNLLFCLIFLIGSKIPGVWGESYVQGSESILNGALDRTFGGTWYVLFGSTVAFATSALVNNFLNYFIGKIFKRYANGFAVYGLRSYVSTAVGQFVDNFIFALIVSHNFFGWSILQCVTCAACGMLVETICEMIFSYFGFVITLRWEREKIGEKYLEHRRNRE